MLKCLRIFFQRSSSSAIIIIFPFHGTVTGTRSIESLFFCIDLKEFNFIFYYIKSNIKKKGGLKGDEERYESFGGGCMCHVCNA